MGTWSQNSVTGDSDYPDCGEDYILQSTPNTWTRKSHTMSDAILDDPYDFAKARQNKSFTLTCNSEGSTTTSTRMINSYYVHTWTDVSIPISLNVNSSKEVALSITPSRVNKKWQVYNYIAFNF